MPCHRDATQQTSNVHFVLLYSSHFSLLPFSNSLPPYLAHVHLRRGLPQSTPTHQSYVQTRAIQRPHHSSSQFLLVSLYKCQRYQFRVQSTLPTSRFPLTNALQEGIEEPDSLSVVTIFSVPRLMLLLACRRAPQLWKNPLDNQWSPAPPELSCHQLVNTSYYVVCSLFHWTQIHMNVKFHTSIICSTFVIHQKLLCLLDHHI